MFSPWIGSDVILDLGYSQQMTKEVVIGGSSPALELVARFFHV